MGVPSLTPPLAPDPVGLDTTPQGPCGSLALERPRRGPDTELCLPADWSSRCKQIMKLWRKVPATDKAPYLVSPRLRASVGVGAPSCPAQL